MSEENCRMNRNNSNSNLAATYDRESNLNPRRASRMNRLLNRQFEITIRHP